MGKTRATAAEKAALGEKVPAKASPKATGRRSVRGKTPGKGKGKGEPKKGVSETGQNVVMLTPLPPGFEEPQLEAFFKQFGGLTGVFVARTKSGRAKAHAFVRFAQPVAAKVAADSLNNYLMFNTLLKATLLPGHSAFRGVWQWAPADAPAKPTRKAKAAGKSLRLLASLKKKNRALAAAGINYALPLPSADDLSRSQLTADLTQQPSFHIDSTEDEISFLLPPNSTKKSLKKIKPPADVTPTPSPKAKAKATKRRKSSTK